MTREKCMSEIYTTDWIRYFIEIAEAASRKSHCVSRSVGSVIVKNKQVLATGFNGVPSGFPHCDICYAGERVSGHGLDDLPCLHAEENALIQCAKKVSDGTVGATIFCTTMPCNRCLRMIIQAGIQKVYFRDLYSLNQNGEKLRQYLITEAFKVNGFTIMQVDL